MKYLITSISLIWIISSFICTGFINADFRGNFKDFSSRCTKQDGRQLLGMAAGLSVLPVTWIMSPFMTGFYQYGWTLEHGPWGGCLK